MQKAIEKQPGFEQWLPDVSQNSNSDKSVSSRRFFSDLLIIVFLSGLAYVAWAMFWIKFSRAEVFFAECAREMIATNNFITPLYHAQPFFDKPIFVYWLIIGMFKTFGVNHFAARLPSIVTSLITITITAFAGSYLFGKKAGLLAAFMLASSFMYLSFSSLCMSDMFLVMFDALSLIAIYAGIIFDKNRAVCWRLAALSMGFAFLTKGPVGIVLPALASLIYLGLTKKLSIIKAEHIIWAVAIIAIVTSPWFYAAYLANGPQSMVHFFIQENLQRFAGSTYDVHKPFWYTIASFFSGFAPWSVLMPLALFWFCQNLSQLRKKLFGKVEFSTNLNYANVQQKLNALLPIDLFSALPFALSAELFLWIWLFVSVGFFCFSRGKCDYYTLPAFTAAALLASHYANNCLAKYCTAIKVLAVTILISTTLFAVLVLPKINELLPVGKYVSIINKGPNNLRVGIDETAASWIDEILFQSGKDPARLSNAQQIDEFISKDGPAMLIMPENKYNLLSAIQKKNYQIISCDKVATHPLTPGYLIEKAGNIVDAVPLVVAVNFRK